MNNLKKVLIILIGTALFCAMPLFAGDKPLGLVSADPSDLSTNVAPGGVITLGFSNNVVNFSISEGNKECFELKTAAGAPVPFEVIMADDQIVPEKKREIIIKPVDGLLADTEYELVIAGSLKAKNGKTLGRDQIIHFTTGS